MIPDYRPCYIPITCSWVRIRTIISRFVYLIRCVSNLSLTLDYATGWILDLRIQFLSQLLHFLILIVVDRLEDMINFLRLALRISSPIVLWSITNSLSYLPNFVVILVFTKAHLVQVVLQRLESYHHYRYVVHRLLFRSFFKDFISSFATNGV